MNQPEDREIYIELSVDILKTQDRKAIEFLKSFLAVLPSLTQIAGVLAAAIERLEQTDAESCRWILRHPHYLMPEFDILAWGHRLILSKLKTERLILEKDFFFDRDGKIILTKRTKERLLVNSMGIERLVLKETISTLDETEREN
ncbi:MAG: hypothetical protein SWY16_07945 [Cyanobacteriota bacterium]|nr:hypothetical protein [Cyanobacteriota bacterium]